VDDFEVHGVSNMRDIFKKFLCWLMGHNIHRNTIYPYTLKCIRCGKRADELDMRNVLQREADYWQGM
jgi:hypothetical protein